MVSNDFGSRDGVLFDGNCACFGGANAGWGCEKTTPQKTDRHITESIDGYVPVVV